MRTFPDTLRGFALPSALFLLVILAMLGAFMLAVSGMQHAAQAVDVSSSRAYQGARAGIEWGLYQVLDGNNDDAGLSASTPQPPACFSDTTLSLGGSFDGASATVTCARTTTTEANRQIAVYAIVSTVSLAGGAMPVSRQVNATVTRCVDPNGTAPRYACP
ncbi:MAG: hypothetical protein JNL33_12260 [Betaproteobacteria bacterium]|nr:hypothetical protein [Betaproteobacteria bacterium]